MGMFFEPTPAHDHVKAAMHKALTQNPPASADVDAQADQLATQALAESPRRFKTGRFLVTVFILVALVAAGWIGERMQCPTTAGALFGMATTVLGAVLAFLATEKSSESPNTTAPATDGSSAAAQSTTPTT